MKINGEHMDDQRFNIIVEILMGRTNVGTPAALARKEATRLAKDAVAKIREWEARRGMPSYAGLKEVSK